MWFLFHQHLHRVEQLERWRELAVRPKEEDCHKDDLDLLAKENDNLQELAQRSLRVRMMMNQRHLPVMESSIEHHLMVAHSQIPNAGNGLYYKPLQLGKERTSDCIFPSGQVLCYYYGHVHDFHSSKHLSDRSYLMLVSGSIFVDPRECLNIKARYINDPLNEDMVNCKYVPEPKFFRSAVVSTKDILPNTELFVSYGELYWSQALTKGTVLQECDIRL